MLDRDIAPAGVAVAVTRGGIVGAQGEGRGIALVDLAEGVRVMTTCSPAVSPGAQVMLSIVTAADGADDLLPWSDIVAFDGR